MNIAALTTTLLLFAAEPTEMPKVHDDRLQLQLVAESPDVRTPTGIGVDEKGRVLVIESHTHFPPEKYEGPKHDRILLLQDFGEDGKAGKISTFFEGTKHTMSLAVFHDGSVYVATRAEIFRLRDKDGDGKAEERTPIAHLETKGDYPHNGLSGFAFDLADNVYFGFGENLGADYKLIGSDGKSLAGGGEGGNIYACDRDGKNLRKFATGFWNPFHVGFDAFGRLFSVDNDPDSRPPCRLLHIVEGGDYGYRFRNGRKGVHPFTAWNGELPGTLPMVAGTGEAPCAVLAYESDNLPSEYIGDLLVTSWGDHRLERYKLKPRGASFVADMTPVVTGDENFRPVGLALAPDGSLYFSDWVDKSYELHGKGRVWRLSAKNPPQLSRPQETIEALASPHRLWREAAARKLTLDQATDQAIHGKNARSRYLSALVAYAEADDAGNFMALVAAKQPDALKLLEDGPRWNGFVEEARLSLDVQRQELRAQSLRLPGLSDDQDTEKYFEPLESQDPFIAQAFIFGLRVDERTIKLLLDDAASWRPDSKPGAALWLANAVRASGHPQAKRLIPRLLSHNSPRVQFLGVMWAGEERATDTRELLAKGLNSAKSRQLFEATLAALSMLDGQKLGDPKAESSGEEYVVKLLTQEQTSIGVRRFALRTLRPDHPHLTAEVLTGLLRDPDDAVRLEAIRTICQKAESERWPQLRGIAKNNTLSATERSEAILGFSPGNDQDRKLLLELAADKVPEVADEALRALRGFDLSPREKEQLSVLSRKLTGSHQDLAQRAVVRNPPKDLPKSDDLAAWLALAGGNGDAAAGERIFFHPRVGSCFRCHEYEGRGYTVGPDLSSIGKSMTRERFIQSLVQPSREMAPQFTPWIVLTTSGETFTGLYVGEEVDGTLKLADQNGRVHRIHPRDIEQKKPSEQSIMPAGLADNLTSQELKDLAAFLLKK
ncbi:MAG: PVC-type heme-binding CxxCH protein [Pirellulaceae bacterium]